MRSFGGNAEVPFKFLEIFHANETEIWQEWAAMVAWYPNNAPLAQDYAQFLANCVGNFDSAVPIQHRAKMIDSRTNFMVDMAFRCMVRAFP
jgi:guanylate cyclase